MIRRMLSAWRRDGNRQTPPVRVYLAARTGRQAELRDIAERLTAAGAEVTSRWLFSEPLTNAELGVVGRATALARMDLEDLERAQLCIAFTEGASPSPGRGGRHTELGIAFALKKRVVVVGPREHVFHCLPEIEHYPSWDEARRALFPSSDQTVRADAEAPAKEAA
jgi:nucleoside 2-deoxyribosyltransferase